jgi:hypothetical protein
MSLCLSQFGPAVQFWSLNRTLQPARSGTSDNKLKYGVASTNTAGEPPRVEWSNRIDGTIISDRRKMAIQAVIRGDPK